MHDAQWAPDGAIFAVVAGYMPSRTQVFDAACRMIADLGTGSHNLLRWSPQVHADDMSAFWACKYCIPSCIPIVISLVRQSRPACISLHAQSTTCLSGSLSMQLHAALELC